MDNYCGGISVGTFYSLQYAMTQSKEPQNDDEKLIIVKPNGGTGSDKKAECNLTQEQHVPEFQ